jgi:predicted extracellular nuclease
MSQNSLISKFSAFLLIFVLVAAALPMGTANASPALSTTLVAYDMVGSASQNLVSYTNVWTDAFTYSSDGFQKYQRWVSPTIPYSVLDDSLSIYTGDSLGIIKEGNTDEFFGVTDTVNGDTSGPVSATWVFDVSGTSDLSLSIDMGAMGDFESSDFFVWEYQFDGGTVETAFANTVDEAGSYTYTLEGGSSYTLSDPMLVDGTILTNDLQTFSTALSGSGSQLTLTLTASTDGGSEAFAFQNIYITSADGPPPPPPSNCGLPYTPVYDIQGNGAASPLDGTLVEVEGVVTGDFQDGKSGFTIQDVAGDGDVTTSDGVFVYASSPDVNVGDLVRVTGYVDEYYDLTEITGVNDLEVCSTGNSVAPTPVSLPVSDFEAYEGMLITFEQSLYISEYYNFARYGEIVLSTERQFQPTAVFDPGSVDAADLLADNLALRIKLDDGNGSQNPDPALHPDGNIFDMTNLFRGGDILNNVTGIVDYNYGEYKLQPTTGADHIEANPRTAQPDDVGGSLKVASFNVLNYFTTLDDGTNDICGPNQNLECRGADTTEEFERQRAKIIAALAAIDADVVGLIEIENNEFEAVADLVAGLNDAVGAGTYGYVDTGYIGEDAIKVAFIYKTATVSLVGDYAILDESVDSRFIDSKNRPALAQTFMDNTTGGVFTAVVNHLKSKGSPCDDIGDPDLGDGAGNCNLTRTAAAEALVDWLATDPTNSGDADFLIIGDLNAYDKEDPIDALIAGGYADLVYQYLGENAYSYVFDGQLGYLDHALANGDLAEEVSGVTIWHINADEANLIDYDMSYKKDAQDALYAPDAYRSSDHDPVVVGMNVCDEIAPTLEIELSVDTLWPANHKYVDITVTVLATDNFDVAPVVELLSVTSSEADEGLGDGDFPNDIVIVDSYTFQLRAERDATNKEGRTYTITYQVTDACGNSTVGSATVYVPFSQKK